MAEDTNEPATKSRRSHIRDGLSPIITGALAAGATRFTKSALGTRRMLYMLCCVAESAVLAHSSEHRGSNTANEAAYYRRQYKEDMAYISAILTNYPSLQKAVIDHLDDALNARKSGNPGPFSLIAKGDKERLSEAVRAVQSEISAQHAAADPGMAAPLLAAGGDGEESQMSRRDIYTHGAAFITGVVIGSREPKPINLMPGAVAIAKHAVIARTLSEHRDELGEYGKRAYNKDLDYIRELVKRAPQKYLLGNIILMQLADEGTALSKGKPNAFAMMVDPLIVLSNVPKTVTEIKNEVRGIVR